MARKTAESTLHAADGIWGSLPNLKEVCLTLTLGWHPLKTWVFVADITKEFILGLDIPCAYDALVDTKAASGRRRGIIMETRGGTPSLQPDSG
jgi:hypothetical protein